VAGLLNGAVLTFLALLRLPYRPFRMFANAECYTFIGALEAIADTLIKCKLCFISISVINKGNLLARTISGGTRFNVSVKSVKDRR
jgi:hypothetical protein